MVLALLAAAANALAMVLQRIGVEEAGAAGGSRNLMARVLRRPVWFAGLALTTASFLLQALALSRGDLSTVQPVMVTELLFLLAILALWFRRTLTWREWLGATGTVVGLGIFLVVSGAGGGQGHPTRFDWILLLIASVGAVALATLAAQRGPRAWRAAWYGVAGGVAFALTAAFIKTATNLWSRGPLLVFEHWQTYGIALAGLAGLVLSQHALEAGPVAASQSALLILNPLSSIVMGVWLFDDRLHTGGYRFALEGVALACMFASLFLLSHSPLISAGAEDHLSAGRRQLDRTAGAAR
ncbi:MAG: putative integral rane protein [Acidimicrobiaceae bacterium]|nr:putative integral rane protein [Acidimicrobiaceae bacterium]